MWNGIRRSAEAVRLFMLTSGRFSLRQRSLDDKPFIMHTQKKKREEETQVSVVRFLLVDIKTKAACCLARLPLIEKKKIAAPNGQSDDAMRTPSCTGTRKAMTSKWRPRAFFLGCTKSPRNTT